jgi:phosphate transport system permease protein
MSPLPSATLVDTPPPVLPSEASGEVELARLVTTAVASDGERTVLPGPPPALAAPQDRRTTGRMSRDDKLNLAGAAVSALATTTLIFGWFTPLSGRLGFTLVAFGLFLGIYALLVSLDNGLPAVVDKVMASLLTAAATVAGAALVSVLVFTFWRGREALVNLNFYTQDMSSAGPLDPLSDGGIRHAVVGTLIIIGISLLVTVPLGLLCAVYLNETGGKITGLVRTIVTAMTALPSILAGLFIFATWIIVLGFERSGVAAAIAVSIMMLPIIIRSAEVVLRLVPGNLREAAAASGAPHWRNVWFVVLPTARSGLATSVILGVARGIGETAPVLLVSGVTSSLNYDPSSNPMMSLPLATFEFVRSPQPAYIARGFATAAVLMVVVLCLFTIARILGGRPAGHLSKRQRRRAEARSQRDLDRIERSLVPAILDAPTGRLPVVPTTHGEVSS